MRLAPIFVSSKIRIIYISLLQLGYRLTSTKNAAKNKHQREEKKCQNDTRDVSRTSLYLLLQITKNNTRKLTLFSLHVKIYE